MLERGIYLAPSAYEAGFMSSKHSDADAQATIDATDAVSPVCSLGHKLLLRRFNLLN